MPSKPFSGSSAKIMILVSNLKLTLLKLLYELRSEWKKLKKNILRKTKLNLRKSALEVIVIEVIVIEVIIFSYH